MNDQALPILIALTLGDTCRYNIASSIVGRLRGCFGAKAGNLFGLARFNTLQMPCQFLNQFNVRWPAIRTPWQLDPRSIRRAVLSGALGSCLIPLAIGLLSFGLAFLLATLTSNEVHEGLLGVDFILTMSPFVPIVALVPALFLSFAAMKFGYAGWMVAIGAGALLATAAFASAFPIDGPPAVVGSITGTAFGALFWLSARLSAPDAFIVNTRGE